jgi:hypothetical protein
MPCPSRANNFFFAFSKQAKGRRPAPARDDYLETANDEQVNWEWEEFKRNLSTKN